MRMRIKMILSGHMRDILRNEGNQMNITADDIRKAALELIGKRTQSSAAVPAEATTVESFTYGYILGVCALAKRVTEDEENDQKRNA